jgi:hypothetical protein
MAGFVDDQPLEGAILDPGLGIVETPTLTMTAT